MKYPWRVRLSALLAVVFVVCFIGISVSRTSIKQENFPLSKKWFTHLRDHVASLSIIGDEMVLARTSNALYALDTQSGKVIWSQDMPWQADPRPAIANKDVIYAVGGDVVKALSRTDGSVMWQQRLYITGAILDVSESILVVEDGRGIHLYNASTGTLLHDNPGCRAVAQAYISGDSVFVPCDGILRINISTAETSWWGENNGIVGSVAYADDVLYFSQAEPRITALDLSNSSELWRVPMEIDGFESFNVFNNSLFFMDASNFCALRRSDGSRQWCVDDVPYPQNPNVIAEIVYIFNGNHKEITAFELRTGNLIGKLQVRNLNYFSTNQQLMVSSDNILFFASGRDVIAFE